jgi:effector-binding domain-containing protein
MRALLVLLLASTAAAEVKVETLTAQPAVTKTIRAKPAQLGAEMQKAILGLVATTEGITGPPFARYVSRAEVYVVEVGLPTKTGKATLPAGPAAVVEFRGPHAKLADAHAELDAWLAANKRTQSARWEVYVTNPITTPDPDTQITRVYAALAK